MLTLKYYQDKIEAGCDEAGMSGRTGFRGSGNPS